MSKEEKKKIFNTQLLKRVFVFAKPYAGRFYLSVALALVLAVFSPLRPLMINYTLKKVNAAGEPVALVLQFLLYITLIQIVFLFIETATKFMFTYITSWLGHKVVKDIRVEVFQKSCISISGNLTKPPSEH